MTPIAPHIVDQWIDTQAQIRRDNLAIANAKRDAKRGELGRHHRTTVAPVFPKQAKNSWFYTGLTLISLATKGTAQSIVTWATPQTPDEHGWTSAPASNNTINLTAVGIAVAFGFTALFVASVGIAHACRLWRERTQENNRALLAGQMTPSEWQDTYYRERSSSAIESGAGAIENPQHLTLSTEIKSQIQIRAQEFEQARQEANTAVTQVVVAEVYDERLI